MHQQLVYLGLVNDRWVVQPQRGGLTTTLPLDAGRPAEEALAVAHAFFPGALVAVAKLWVA